MVDCEQFLYSHKSRPGRNGERAKWEENCAESRRLIRSLVTSLPTGQSWRTTTNLMTWYSISCWQSGLFSEGSMWFNCFFTNFAFTTLGDWLKRFAPLFYPIRSKTKTNCNALACIFPRFASATCNYFEFWLVHCIVCVLCDWLE